jgi:hypothetical protein
MIHSQAISSCVSSAVVCGETSREGEQTMNGEKEDRVYIHHREFASQMVLDSLFKLVNAYS